MPKPAYDEATDVDAVDGEVTLSGPDGVGVSMTPRAAHETAVRLAVKAGKAREQIREKGDRG
jgi:hypothetical protein